MEEIIHSVNEKPITTSSKSIGVAIITTWLMPLKLIAIGNSFDKKSVLFCSRLSESETLYSEYRFC